MKKRLVTILLGITITVSTLAGCGSDGAASTNYDDGADYGAEYYESEPMAEADYSYSTSDYEYTDSTTDYYADVEEDYSYEAATSASSTNGNRRYAAEAKTAAESVRDDYDSNYSNGEEYQENKENGFCNAVTNPLSTFAADVDTASYANMRRMIEDWGYGVDDFPEGSIRAEELINYFHYDYDRPGSNEVFDVDARIAECPWNEDNQLMILGITAEALKRKEKPASNIVFLIDVSGSMSSSNKLPLLQESMKLLVEELDENDRVSIVTYASGTDVVAEGISGDKHSKITRAFDSLSAGGATNGEGGIELAYEVAEEYFIKDGNNRVIIASDGDFNVGASSQQDLYDLISEKKESGVFLSVLGFGTGNYSDVTMETLADNGDGNYAYIDSLSEAKKFLVDEFAATLYTVAKDTKFQVEFNPALVDSYRLIGYENRTMAAQDFTNDKKDGGEIGSGRQVTVIYEICLANRDNGNGDLKYQDTIISDKGKEGDEWCTLSVAYKEPDGNKSKYLEFPIGVKNYTEKVSDDFKFAAAVAETAMALNDSRYLEDVDKYEAIEEAYETVLRLDLDDEYKEEFVYLLGNLTEGNYRDYDKDYDSYYWAD